MRANVIVLFLCSGLLNISAAQSSHKHARSSTDSVQAAERSGRQPCNAIQSASGHVRYLSHDLLEGRGTGQRGGDIAAEYIATQFALYGLKARRR